MKTVSLELSKRLKEQGYPQETEHFWCYEWDINNERTGEKLVEPLKDIEYFEAAEHVLFASPTADEILEQLPSFVFINGDHHALDINRPNNQQAGGDWYVRYVFPNFMTDSSKQEYEYDSSLADAAAKMWLYLKKEGLLGEE